jgi:hypothetical protein
MNRRAPICTSFSRALKSLLMGGLSIPDDPGLAGIQKFGRPEKIYYTRAVPAVKKSPGLF